MTKNQVVRNINTDRVIDIANALLSKVNEVFDSEKFPDSFTNAEFAIASILMAREVEKSTSTVTVPSDIYLDEFTKSYMEFIRLVNEEGAKE